MHGLVVLVRPVAQLALQDADERRPERRVEHGVDDGVGQRRRVPHPQDDRHDRGRHVGHAVGARHRQHVHDEERRPQHDEHQEDDPQHLGRLALVGRRLLGQQVLGHGSPDAGPQRRPEPVLEAVGRLGGVAVVVAQGVVGVVFGVGVVGRIVLVSVADRQRVDSVVGGHESVEDRPVQFGSSGTVWRGLDLYGYGVGRRGGESSRGVLVVRFVRYRTRDLNLATQRCRMLDMGSRDSGCCGGGQGKAEWSERFFDERFTCREAEVEVGLWFGGSLRLCGWC